MQQTMGELIEPRMCGLDDCSPRLIQHRARGGDDCIHGDFRDAMRPKNAAGRATILQPMPRLQDTNVRTLGSETRRTVEVVGVAIERMPGDDDDLAIHCRGQVSAAAVIADEQLAALEHGTDLAQPHAAQYDGDALQRACQL